MGYGLYQKILLGTTPNQSSQKNAGISQIQVQNRVLKKECEMFQVRKNVNKKWAEDMLNQFRGVIKFADTLTDSNDDEFEMDAWYKPNWSCVWNKVDAIDKPCLLLAKDDRFGIVEFYDEEIKSETSGSPAMIYRLEDLGFYKMVEYKKDAA